MEKSSRDKMMDKIVDNITFMQFFLVSNEIGVEKRYASSQEEFAAILEREKARYYMDESIMHVIVRVRRDVNDMIANHEQNYGADELDLRLLDSAKSFLDWLNTMQTDSGKTSSIPAVVLDADFKKKIKAGLKNRIKPEDEIRFNNLLDGKSISEKIDIKARPADLAGFFGKANRERDKPVAPEKLKSWLQMNFTCNGIDLKMSTIQKYYRRSPKSPEL